MSDKLKSGVSVVPEFVAGEQPSAAKFTAIGAQNKLGLALLEEAVGDLWAESWPYSADSNTHLTMQWPRNFFSGNAAVDSVAKGSALDIPNLARLIGPASRLNPYTLSGTSNIVDEPIPPYVNSFTLRYVPSNTPVFTGAGTVLSNLVSSLTAVQASGDYYVNISTGTYYCYDDTLAGMSVTYETDPAARAGGAAYSGARFNVIPDSSQIEAGSTEKIGISGPAADGSYTLTMPLVTHQQATLFNLTTALLPAYDPNTSRRIELPKVLSDNLSTGDVIPDGFIYLKNYSTGEVYRDATYVYLDVDSIKVFGADLGQPADYNSEDWQIVTVGTDITTSLSDAQRKIHAHSHNGAHGESRIAIQDLIDITKTGGVSGPFVPSELPGNIIPQYLHRDGYRTGYDDANANDRNAMRGNLVFSNTGVAGDRFSSGNAYGLAWGVPSGDAPNEADLYYNSTQAAVTFRRHKVRSEKGISLGTYEAYCLKKAVFDLVYLGKSTGDIFNIPVSSTDIAWVDIKSINVSLTRAGTPHDVFYSENFSHTALEFAWEWSFVENYIEGSHMLLVYFTGAQWSNDGGQIKLVIEYV